MAYSKKSVSKKLHMIFLKKSLNEPVQAHGLFFMLKQTVSSYNLEAVFILL